MREGVVDRGDDEVLEHLDILGSTTAGSMVMLTSSCLPVTVALTTPPPAEPSTVAASSSVWTRSISCCICCAMRCRLPMPIVWVLLVSSGSV